MIATMTDHEECADQADAAEHMREHPHTARIRHAKHRCNTTRARQQQQNS